MSAALAGSKGGGRPAEEPVGHGLLPPVLDRPARSRFALEWFKMGCENSVVQPNPWQALRVSTAGCRILTKVVAAFDTFAP
jgi:hypothetical protein